VRRSRGLALALALVVVLTVLVEAAADGSSTARPGARAIVAFVGDSNITFGASAIATALAARADPYVAVDYAQPAAAIKSLDCFFGIRCGTAYLWPDRLRATAGRIVPDAYVVDLGINDAHVPGEATSFGYSDYAAKIDWLMRLFGSTPVIWSTLPCEIEPADYKAGCAIVNREIRNAPARHPNLTVLEWAPVADPHPAYIRRGEVHYTDAGYAAWADLLVRNLDERLPRA
jgi:hypothetical protein